MNATDHIAALLKAGCKGITFTLSPQGACAIVAEQIIQTGPNANFIRAIHQEEGEDFGPLLNKLGGHVSELAEMKTSIVVPIKRN